MQLLAIKAGSEGMCSPVDEGWAPVKGGAASRQRVYKGVEACSESSSPSSLYSPSNSFSITTTTTSLLQQTSPRFLPVLPCLFQALLPLILPPVASHSSILPSLPAVVCLGASQPAQAPFIAIMPATTAYRQPTIPALPVTVPGKSPYYTPPTRTASYSRVSMSPPEAGSSMNTSAVPSLTSSTYGGSAASDYESSHGGSSGVDLIDMLNDRLSNAVDPIPLDRSLAKQAQT